MDGGELDFKTVAQSVSESDKLARRLGNNLMMPQPEGEQQFAVECD